MNTSRYFCYSGLSIALAVVCWSSPALGSDDFEPPAPAVPAPVYVPDYCATAPAQGAAGVCRCTPACGRSRGVFRWFRRKPQDCPTAEYDALYSGCNVHPDPPFGASYHATMQAQVARGEAARMVLYQFDFVPGEATLNYRGRLRLQKIAQLLPQNAFPLIIEASRHDSELDAARHASVVAELSRLPFPVPAERILIDRSPSRGLDGLDAEVIHRNLLGLTAGGGAAGPPAGGAGVAVPVPR